MGDCKGWTGVFAYSEYKGTLTRGLKAFIRGKSPGLKPKGPGIAAEPLEWLVSRSGTEPETY